MGWLDFIFSIIFIHVYVIYKPPKGEKYQQLLSENILELVIRNLWQCNSMARRCLL